MKSHVPAAMFFAFFVSGAAWADEWSGTVVAVTDGDTVQVKPDKEGTVQQVRIWGIHAPEPGQPFAGDSKANLSRLVLGKQVEILDHGEDERDHYEKIIGRVMVATPDCHDQVCPKNINVALAQIQAGLAWQYGLHHDDDRSSANKQRYAMEQQAAKTAGVGLWSDPAPVSPWDWRKEHGGNKDEVPVTVEAAVDILMDVMSAKDLAKIQNMSKSDMVSLHFGLGMWIRNIFGLRRGNYLLLEATGADEPDGASGVILDALLTRLKKETPNSYLNQWFSENLVIFKLMDCHTQQPEFWTCSGNP